MVENIVFTTHPHGSYNWAWPTADDMNPPNAKDVPLPQNLVELPYNRRRYIPKVFQLPWLGRTPCKNQHRNKAMEAIKEIVGESNQKTTNGRKKSVAKLAKRLREKSLNSTKDTVIVPNAKIDFAGYGFTDPAVIDMKLTTQYETDAATIAKDSFSQNDEFITPSYVKPRVRSLYCTTCHKGGHTSLVCYRNTIGKDIIRCYNCGKIGHLAVRCYNTTTDSSVNYPTTPPPKEETKSKTKKVPKTKLANKKQTEAEKLAAEADLKREKTGIELICKIMADRPLREETQRCHPQLYEEMLAIMLANITFPIPS